MWAYIRIQTINGHSVRILLSNRVLVKDDKNIKPASETNISKGLFT